MDNTEVASIKPSPVGVVFQYLPKLNYAMHHNGVSLIRSFVLSNTSAGDLNNLSVSIIPADPFFKKNCFQVSELKREQVIDLSSTKLELNPSFIVQLTERMESSLTVEVSVAGEVVYSQDYPISILTFNEWSGYSVFPFLLASFVTPNAPSVAPVLKRAAGILKEWTGDSSLSGYQLKDADRVKKTAAAIFEALKELRLVYCEPPASFEKDGQRIRLADDVVKDRLATCIDTSVLYASCLEAAGLYPLLVLVKGHAFAGVWLVSDTLPESVYDDPALLSKHVALNDIVLVETTKLAEGCSFTFDEIAELGVRHLDKQSDFLFVADVARCRFMGVHPLPTRVVGNDGQWTIDEKSLEEVKHVEPVKIDRYEIQSQSTAAVTKQTVWERKLLDLSLRNSLLNCRITKRTLCLLVSDVGRLEDALFAGDDFQIFPRLPEMAPNDEKDDLLTYAVSGLWKTGQFVEQQLANKRLYSVLSESENANALKALYRAAKLSVEESGANSLYLALGMLCWQEPKVPKKLLAPILLIPMEMVRRGAGYVVRTRDEETLLNVTLLEMLRQNFHIQVPGLDSLPEDEHGIDVKKVLDIFRNAVMEQKGWDVLEMAVLGNFSFNKFIMWNDIHANMEELRKNKIVDSLIQGKLMLNVDSDEAGARQLDHLLSPVELALPVGADSSQLEAVYAASEGRSFILHGPPGTGKSQTITNIIANALFQGKRVLFAAEKMAALSVVQKRLAKIGLAPFCLEVHSNKAKKSDVLAQLQASSEVTKVKSPAEFETEAAKLMELRMQLNSYVEKLHQPSSCGVSLYEAVTRFCLLENQGIGSDFSVPADLLASLSADKLALWSDAVEQLAIVAESCGHPATHPLRLLSFDSYSPDLQQKLTDACEKNIDLLKLARNLIGELRLNAETHEKFHHVLLLSSAIAELPDLTPELVRQPDVLANSEHIINLLEHGKHMRQICDELCVRYTDGVFALPAEVLKAEWDKAGQKWALPKWISRRGIRKKLETFAKGTVSLPADLDAVVAYQHEKAAFESQQHVLSLFGSHPRTTVADWDDLIAMERGMVGVQKALNVVANDLDQMLDFKNSLARQLADGFASFKNYGGALYLQLADIFSKLKVTDAELFALGNLDSDAVLDTSLPFVDARIDALSTVRNNLSKLKDRFNYLLERKKMTGAQLECFVSFVEKDSGVQATDWRKTFECGFYKSLALFLFAQDPGMALFKGDIFESNIKRFRDLNAQYQELVKAELFARLASRHPDFTIEAANSSEVGILQKNIHNKGRGMALRSLFDAIPNMLSRLTPCLLMSPMSIAQYLDVNKHPKFDLVIFDEASQMPTSEAVGAIARGVNVVVVGDPKQMPPTAFFTTNTVEEEEPGIDDLESILDDCLALSIPSKYLRFHYRSKHESLIAFSNSQYYGSKLCSFPSPDNRVSKVTFNKVEGHYDKGKSRQNKAEAQAVVDEVVRRLNDENLRKRSIGIVTFSVVQQSLIDDLLTEVFAKQPDLDAYANQCAEPIFVKNLENVQGDERDVILFSVGYGPDEKGNVSMNFGPLNQVGGERRLNVAVSRARYEMKVFSTLTADMIDLNRTDAEGVRGLKEFLAFAQHGTRALTEGDIETIKGRESIDAVIASELGKLGYETDTEVGSSSFRIDVAVVDPSDKGRYLLGIVCDGDSYYGAETARDREVCQPDILRGLGWNIVKVWTVDWWEDKETVLKKIVGALENAKMGKNGSSYSDPAKPAAVKLEAVPVDGCSNRAGGVEKVAYRLAETEKVPLGTDAMVSPDAVPVLERQMKTIVSVESPVTVNYLFHKVMEACEVSRMTQRVETRLKEVLDRCSFIVTDNGRQAVVWADADAAQSLNCFRTPSERDSSDIPVEEYACAMRFVLAQQLSLGTDDLKRQTSLQMGFARMGGNLDEMLSLALVQLQNTNLVEVADNKVKLV